MSDQKDCNSSNDSTMNESNSNGNGNGSSCYYQQTVDDNSSTDNEIVLSKQRKELFGDCALIEIIHLHDCLRGALRALLHDVYRLAQSAQVDVNDVQVQVQTADTDQGNDNDNNDNNLVTSTKTDTCHHHPVLDSTNTNTSTLNIGTNATTNSTTTTAVVATTVELERRVAGRFKVIWSVFKSHSHAEDEFIWPALKEKTAGRVGNHNSNSTHDHHHHQTQQQQQQQQQNNNDNYNKQVTGIDTGTGAVAYLVIQPPALVAVATTTAAAATNTPDEMFQPVQQGQPNNLDQQQQQQQPVLLEQEEYEEDHADEERMFSQMDQLLTKIHDTLRQQPRKKSSVTQLLNTLVENTQKLSQHLMTHLQKEETQCMPLVVQHLSKDEIHELVGQIMGQRSADTIAQIMTMAVQNLKPCDRHEMIKYMKQSMAGTFFDRWLLMSGWMKDINSTTAGNTSCDTPNNDNVSQQQQQQSPSDCDDDECKVPSDNAADTTLTDINVPENTVQSPLVASRRQHRADSYSSSGTSRASKRSRTNSTASNSRHHLPTLVQSTALITNQHDSNNFIDTTTNTNSGLVASITSQAELEKLIRAIATNPSLNPVQKNTTIQGLRDSVWKSNQRYKQTHQQPPTMVNQTPCIPIPFQQQHGASRNSGDAAAASGTANSISRSRRVAPPSSYFIKNSDGKIELVWSSRHHRHSHTSTRSRSTSPARVQVVGTVTTTVAAVTSNVSVKKQDSGDYSSNDSIGNDQQSIADIDVPLFSASELAPSYHDGAAGTVLGCPHYARACKIRHPKSGRLYTCLICCEQQRELPNGERDDTLDRYAVTEVMCMKCNALQPADDRCVNPDCDSFSVPFAKYFCNICHLYDDGTRPIFHCPYCNICRLGLGLGIDYRHCMRCNACVSLADKDHRCIPQKLQGNCPICRDELFLSTEPLRGLKCGHVMHLSCFTEYRRGLSYTCPLCMRAMEDMTDYFALLDAAIRMQPMPLQYINTMSNIYCQDCNQTCRVPYHFIGKKCSHCGSYNTRELGRVQITTTPSSQTQSPPTIMTTTFYHP